MPPLRKLIAWLMLFLSGAAGAWAHDPLQANTNIWLRPSQMEVEVIMSRAPVRRLLDNAPDVPLTEDNFATLYQPLLKKSAPQMLALTTEGQPLAPTSVVVELFEETDIKFSFLYPRPPNGRLRVTANFIKRMSEGFGNNLGMNEDRKVLGYGDQSASNPDWEINLGKDTGITPPSELGPPPPLPASLQATANTKAPTTALSPKDQDSYFIIPHFHLLALGGITVVIILLAIGRIRQKS